MLADDLRVNQWDINTWNTLLSYIKDFPIDISRPFYESILTQFSACAQFWEIYINREIESKNKEKAIKVIEETKLVV